MNFDAVKRQVQAAIDMGCYELAECLAENAQEELTEVAAEEIAKQVVAGAVKPGGLLHGLLFGESSGGVVKP